MRWGLLLIVVLLAGCGGRSAYSGPLSASAAGGNQGGAPVGHPVTLGLGLDNSSGERLTLDKVELLKVEGPIQILGAYAAHVTFAAVYLWPSFPPDGYSRRGVRPLKGFVVPPHDHGGDLVFVEVRLAKHVAASVGSVRLFYHSKARGYHDDLVAQYTLLPTRPVRACLRDQGCIENRKVDEWVANGTLPRLLAPAAHSFVRDGCANCHTYRNIGATNLDAPDLTFGGPHKYSATRLDALLRCPSCVQAGSAMPSFAAAPKALRAKLAAFLVASR